MIPVSAAISVSEEEMRVEQTPERPDDLISVRQAAERCSVSTATIRRYIKSGRLPAVRIGPQVWRIRVADLAVIRSPIGGEHDG